jgi:hypothetical protein
MSAPSSEAVAIAGGRDEARRYLSAWTIGDLPAPPAGGWRFWVGLIGPGVVLAGTSIGSGEWLFGPAVTAQYGASLLWLALLSIILQAFCNLVMMRYAVYCGEPIIVGGLRTRPGPAWWIGLYAILDIAAIWPYNASNAAVPVAALVLGHLPQTASDQVLVKTLGFVVFVLAFVPLIFGGTVYRMLEKIMTAKLVLVLGYLSIIALLMVSWPVMRDVAAGFLRFGTIPLRAQTIILERHFSVKSQLADIRVRARGTWERDGSPTGDFLVTTGPKVERYSLRNEDEHVIPSTLRPVRNSLLAEARAGAWPEHFRVRTGDDHGELEAEGKILEHHLWVPDRFQVVTSGVTRDYGRLEDVPEPDRSRLRNLLRHEGVEYVGFVGYVGRHGHLPSLDWAMVVAFIGIAGAGGLSNTLFSNYARDKGWGMGARVGAIPSAIGGRTIGLSHTGCVFPLDEENLDRWKRWMRHIRRDQGVWVIASIMGMALPCMMSLEFIRNATVTGDRVAAMTAEGIADRYPGLAGLFWILTLLCGFLVLAPGQVSVGDQIARRWTDMIWTASPRIKSLGKGEVRYLYYGILLAYGAWGLFVLWLLPALQIAKIGAVLGNVALGVSSLQALYVNQRLLPDALRPNFAMQLGVALCGLFFLGISIAVIATL